ncbi:hypothetical protein LINPERPRIM_LOCUS21370 [Linum perenne]
MIIYQYSLFNFSSQPRSYELYLRCLGFNHNGFWWRIRLTSNQIGFWTMKQLKPDREQVPSTSILKQSMVGEAASHGENL